MFLPTRKAAPETEEPTHTALLLEYTTRPIHVSFNHLAYLLECLSQLFYFCCLGLLRRMIVASTILLFTTDSALFKLLELVA
jgi:hypothetical protein